MKSFFDVVNARRSVRKFKPEPVPPEHITQMLDAARLAPTAGNQQPWKFLVVQDQAKIAELKEACIEARLAKFEKQENPSPAKLAERRAELVQYYQDFLSVPLCILVFTDDQSNYPSYNAHDGPLAAGHLILAARSLGYGTVYTTDSVPEEVTRAVFGVPEQYRRVCLLPIGVPESWPERKAKKELAELVVYEAF